MRIAILGAGLTGLSASYQLASAGHRVTVFESAPEVGGLARGFEVAGTLLERYYHHIFTHDTTFLEYARLLGVDGQLDWLPSRMGTFAQGAVHPFMTPGDLLAFPHLSLLERIRFGIATLIARGIKHYEPLEHETAESWLRRLFGAGGYREVWEPLMRKKFEAHTPDVAAVWIWGKIALRGSSREKGHEKELLGYMRGSFQIFHEALAKACQDKGAEIALGDAVSGLHRHERTWTVTTARTERSGFDQVLVTLPPRSMASLVSPHMNPDEQTRLANLKFQGAMVAVLKLDRRLTNYYWINVNDYEIPFGGVIEHTNLLPPSTYGDHHIVYLSRYIHPTDALFGAPEESVLDEFYRHVTKFNPAFERHWVQAAWVFRDAYAQPVITRHYRDQAPPLATSAEGLFLANMGHIFPEDRGMNYALALGKRASQAMLRQESSALDTPLSHP